jgi:hypothetical protein
MTMTGTPPTTRTADLLLVRLLAPAKKPPAPARLREDLRRLLRQPLDANRWQALVDELVASGLISTKPMRLTEAGRSRALQFLALSELPRGVNWRTLRDRHLVPLALGIPAGDGAMRKRLQTKDGLGALLVKRRYHLPAGTGHTLHAALEALACQQLGFPEETKLQAVCQAVLGRLLDSPTQLDREELTRQLVQKIAGSRRADLGSLREAVLRDLVEPPAEHAPEPPRAGEATPAAVEPETFDLAAFAGTVQAAARACPTGRFGDNKVFVHHVWKQLQEEPGFPVQSLGEFKRRLTEANHAGLLRLSRADLVQAMDPADVQQAETHYLDAVFHFILIEREHP